jgi:hypothetical protein
MKTKKSPLEKILFILLGVAMWSILFFWVLQDWLNLPKRIADKGIVGELAAKIALGVFFAAVIIKIIFRKPKRSASEIEFDKNEESGYGHIPRSIKDSRK